MGRAKAQAARRWLVIKKTLVYPQVTSSDIRGGRSSTEESFS
jgi:hypothetical protein